jgi:hypothetical protein
MTRGKANLALLLLLFTLPAAAQNPYGSSIASFSDSYGEHVYYVGMNYHVYQLYWDGGNPVNQDLTQWTGGTLAWGGPLTAFSDSYGEHVFYVGNGPTLDQLWWSGSETYQNLTNSSGAVKPYPNAISSFSDSYGEHLYYFDDQFDQTEYELSLNSNGSWSGCGQIGVSDGDLAGLATFGDSSGEYVYYTAAANQWLYAVYRTGGEICADTSSTPLVVNAVGVPTALATYNNSSGHYVFYIGTNQHVYQLFTAQSGIFGTWTTSDLTEASDTSVVAASATALTAFSDSAGEHVFYVGTNQHVYQLYFNGTSWSNQDLSGSGTVADDECGAKLTSFSDSYGEHVYYVGTNGHVYHLYWNSQYGWALQDMTTWSGATELALSGYYCIPS